MRLPSELYYSAAGAGAARSATQQKAHWAKLGRERRIHDNFRALHVVHHELIAYREMSDRDRHRLRCRACYRPFALPCSRDERRQGSSHTRRAVPIVHISNQEFDLTSEFPQIPTRFSSGPDAGSASTPTDADLWTHAPQFPPPASGVGQAPTPWAQPVYEQPLAPTVQHGQPHPGQWQTPPPMSPAQRGPRLRFTQFEGPRKAAAVLWWTSAVWFALTPTAWVLSSAFSIGFAQGGIFGLFRFIRLFDRASEVDGFTEISTGALVIAYTVLTVLAAASITAYAVVIQFALHRDVRGGRILASVLTGVGLLGLFGGPLSVIWVLITVAGTICAWIPARTSIASQAQRIADSRLGAAAKSSPQLIARGVNVAKSPELRASVTSGLSSLKGHAERLGHRVQGRQEHVENAPDQHEMPPQHWPKN